MDAEVVKRMKRRQRRKEEKDEESECSKYVLYCTPYGIETPVSEMRLCRATRPD